MYELPPIVNVPSMIEPEKTQVVVDPGRRLQDADVKVPLNDLAAVAANTGYSDQAHLTREFARFAGTAMSKEIAPWASGKK